ncbi:hypothetical protein ACWET9_48585, partial [Streptomyces sp. NPDC004059]
MSRKLPLADGETSRTARALVRTGVEEKTGEVVTTAALAERVGWCTELAAAMMGALLAEHWNTADVNTLASGQDAGGRKLPSNAWMALRVRREALVDRVEVRDLCRCPVAAGE